MCTNFIRGKQKKDKLLVAVGKKQKTKMWETARIPVEGHHTVRVNSSKGQGTEHVEKQRNTAPINEHSYSGERIKTKGKSTKGSAMLEQTKFSGRFNSKNKKKRWRQPGLGLTQRFLPRAGSRGTDAGCLSSSTVQLRYARKSRKATSRCDKGVVVRHETT